MPFGNSKAVFRDGESHPSLVQLGSCKTGDRAMARFSGDFSGFDGPRKKIKVSSKNHWLSCHNDSSASMTGGLRAITVGDLEENFGGFHPIVHS